LSIELLVSLGFIETDYKTGNILWTGMCCPKVIETNANLSQCSNSSSLLHIQRAILKLFLTKNSWDVADVIHEIDTDRKDINNSADCVNLILEILKLLDLVNTDNKCYEWNVHPLSETATAVGMEDTGMKMYSCPFQDSCQVLDPTKEENSHCATVTRRLLDANLTLHEMNLPKPVDMLKYQTRCLHEFMDAYRELYSRNANSKQREENAEHELQVIPEKLTGKSKLKKDSDKSTEYESDNSSTGTRSVKSILDAGNLEEFAASQNSLASPFKRRENGIDLLARTLTMESLRSTQSFNLLDIDR